MPVPSFLRPSTLVLGGLLLLTLGWLLAATAPATAANTNVTIVTGGTFVPPSCDAASYAYDPIEVAIQPGDTVTFSNPGARSQSHPCEPAAHPTRCAPETNFGKTKGDCPFSNFGLETGASHTQPFPSEGTFQLQCLAHPYMLMTVIVGDGEPGGGPTEPEPTETETTPEPGPEPDPTETTPAPATATPSETASAAPAPTTTATSTESASEAPSAVATAPTEAATDQTALDDFETGTTSAARGPLLILATALLGANVALFTVVRGPFALPSFLR